MPPFFSPSQQIFSPSLWQSTQWERFQQTAQNNTFRISYQEASALIITRTPHWLKFWKPTLWELPRGPYGNKKDFEALFKKIIKSAQENNITTLRVYPPFGEEKFWNSFSSFLHTQKYSFAPDIFPQHTLMLDLTKTKNEILAQMKPKGRYNIRLAKRKGIKIFKEDTLENFWDILQQTTRRDRFTANKKYVYKAMMDSFGENATLLSAKDETGEILASKIFLAHKEYGIYYYGASSNKKRNLMAPYLLQWEGICWAKSKGAKIYDFLGISPEGNTEHQLSSVSQFKHKFGGYRVICDQGIDFHIL